MLVEFYLYIHMHTYEQEDLIYSTLYVYECEKIIFTFLFIAEYLFGECKCLRVPYIIRVQIFRAPRLNIYKNFKFYIK